MKETYNLELIFDRPSGKTGKITLRQPKVGLTEAEIRPNMEAIAASGLFHNGEENIYHAAKEARYVRNTIEEVFSAE